MNSIYLDTQAPMSRLGASADGLLGWR